MENEQKAYRNIFKATALFGGVQVFNILLSLVRTKIVAVLLGVSGIGLMGLLTNTLAIISSITRLGVDQGAIRDVSMSVGNGKIGEIATVVKRWSLFVGLLGAIVTLSLAPQLSLWSFGTDKYTLAFCWLACTMFFDALTKGQLAIFQGLRKLRTLAKSNLIGATVSLILSIPIYYIWGVDGIVPAMIITYVCSFLISSFYYRKEKITEIPLTVNETVHKGLGIMKLGVILTISGFITTLVSYLFNIYLSSNGGLQDVGLYQSGFNLIEKYVGLIFVAMGTDYYPRLAEVNHDNKKIETIMNQQAIISFLILGPVICLFLPTAPLIIRLLLSKEFLPILPFLSWAILGILFKAASWCMGFIFIAKGANKVFIYSEIASSLIILIFNIIGYNLWNIKGIGIAFTLSYIFHLIIIITLGSWKFKISYNTESKRIFLFTLLPCIVCFLSSTFTLGYIYYFTTILIFLFSAFYSMMELKKRLHLQKR
ncbi:MAG: O-antigen translocase [Bacteroides sp.]